MTNNMEKNPTDFESCKNMIYKLAKNQYLKIRSKRPDIQFDDLYSEGQLIYTMCLKKYTGSKNCKFTTYLYQNLVGRLADYCDVTMKTMCHYEDYTSNKSFAAKAGDQKDMSVESRIKSIDYEIDNNDLLITAKEELSYEGYQVLKFIISREWENFHAKSKPTNLAISRKFGYPQHVIDSVMGEIKNFWMNKGYAVA